MEGGGVADEEVLGRLRPQIAVHYRIDGRGTTRMSPMFSATQMVSGLAPALINIYLQASVLLRNFSSKRKWSHLRDLNPGPTVYETVALPLS